jgi:hypothetical protein
VFPSLVSIENALDIYMEAVGVLALLRARDKNNYCEDSGLVAIIFK